MKKNCQSMCLQKNRSNIINNGMKSVKFSEELFLEARTFTIQIAVKYDWIHPSQFSNNNKLVNKNIGESSPLSSFEAHNQSKMCLVFPNSPIALYRFTYQRIPEVF